MTIAREEIFGPVLSILSYGTVDEAVEIANDTEYGLAAYVSGKDPAKLLEIASRLRAGQVNLNNAPMDPMAPFGGYKTSGNGREWGDYAFAEFLETKANASCPRQSGNTSTRREPHDEQTKRFSLAMFGNGVSGASLIASKVTGVEHRQFGLQHITHAPLTPCD
jgi:delta 1-pyrroline-5-carboxylate dehydrogenase